MVEYRLARRVLNQTRVDGALARIELALHDEPVGFCSNELCDAPAAWW
jgi:hypothetical protein